MSTEKNKREFMHEWCAKDSPQFDIDPEKITERLCQENAELLAEVDSLRARLAAAEQKASEGEKRFGPVLAELERATRKFPTWPTDPLHALAVLGEEYGELTKEMLQLTYEPHKTNPDKVRTEAVQCATMALRLLMSLDRYEYKRGEQHSQQSDAAMRKGEG